MNRYDIGTQGIELKNLFSGPAPVGRILNYVYLIGTTGLKHKNGYRSLDLSKGIGSAWCTEFMIGLGLARLGSPVNDAFILNLTDDGQVIFDLLAKKTFDFDEGSNDGNIATVKAQMNTLHPDLYTSFKEVFLKSYSFLLLKDYLKEKGYCFEKSEFYGDFFYWAEEQLNLTPEKNNAGFNRLPSLIQLCILFDLVEAKNGKLSFKIDRLKHQPIPEIKRAYTKDELKESAKKEEIIESSAEELVARYGEDGNVIVSAIVRNSSLQAKFKHNLLIQQKGKCVVCGMEQKELLIGSHIKPSAKCDVNEKIDYNNGLLLCCNHDKLFDKYLISFDADTGDILISGTLKQNDIKRLNLSQNYRLDKSLLSEERKKYLRLHNNKFKEEEDLRN